MLSWFSQRTDLVLSDIMWSTGQLVFFWACFKFINVHAGPTHLNKKFNLWFCLHKQTVQNIFFEISFIYTTLPRTIHGPVNLNGVLNSLAKAKAKQCIHPLSVEKDYNISLIFTFVASLHPLGLP